jgi:predicted acetyltransferase
MAHGNDEFDFIDPGRLVDGELELILVQTAPADPERGLVPYYVFEMRVGGEKVGGLNLRIGNTHDLVTYGGHIGYGVNPEHRGHHYAERACRMVLPLAKAHGLNPLWITCNPDNIPSRRTCERLGAEMVEIVSLPEGSDMYKHGERQKCRFRVDL